MLSIFVFCLLLTVASVNRRGCNPWVKRQRSTMVYSSQDNEFVMQRETVISPGLLARGPCVKRHLSRLREITSMLNTLICSSTQMVTCMKRGRLTTSPHVVMVNVWRDQAC